MYLKHYSQRRVNTAKTFVIQLLFKSMETNELTPKWGCNPFWSDSIDFNKRYVESVIAALTLR